MATVDAIAQMSRVPGLRVDVQRRVQGVLEAALESRKLPSGTIHHHAPLIARVGEYEVFYTLDLKNACATILNVEPFDHTEHRAHPKARRDWAPARGARRLI
jgi:hypothetical protein